MTEEQTERLIRALERIADRLGSGVPNVGVPMPSVVPTPSPAIPWAQPPAPQPPAPGWWPMTPSSPAFPLTFEPMPKPVVDSRPWQAQAVGMGPNYRTPLT